ncbi:hypothetical protein PYCC9005_004527 [Savitreella phatthalungensis]
MVKFKIKLGGGAATPGTPGRDNDSIPGTPTAAPAGNLPSALARPGLSVLGAGSRSASAIGSTGSLPRVKIKAPLTGMKVKVKQSQASSTKITLRKSIQAGYGYDSEASDREDDPLIETCLLMRWKPSVEADFVRERIAAKERMDFISVKWKDSRNAVVILQHDNKRKLFAARLVDLPTITEVHKTFDKKNIYKVADLCQMLLVGDRVSHEDTVVALPTRPQDLQYPHGITPPLRHVRKRRFRKRASAKTIELVEKEVERLLGLDARSEQTTYEIMDRDQLERESTASPRPYGDEMDIDGMNAGDDEGDGEDYDDYAADLEAQLNSPMPPVSPYTPGAMTPAIIGEVDTPAGGHPGETPAAATSGSSASEAGSDDDEEEDGEDDEEDGDDGPLEGVEGGEGADKDPAATTAVGPDGNPTASAASANATKPKSAKSKKEDKALKEGVNSLLDVIAAKKAEIERTINPIMKQRLMLTLRKFENQLEMKRAGLE